ncbi:double zinc ribbon domain-containing protein [Halomarina rubra]|uniref:Zinc ribbon domain-containing protein n=1 Tax=Halomarina rubra TaxID=2071873 RepID=A0ABD6ATM4_9EURY|nr:CopG family transcriptional regulator [Halomarina rubra]
MSKITFRADDDLVARIEACEGSKSEVMREALRAYLDDASARDDDERPAPSDGPAVHGSLDALVRERVDTLVDQRIDAVLAAHERRHGRRDAQDINVNVTLDGDRAPSRSEPSAQTDRPPRSEQSTSDGEDGRKQCSGCGTSLAGDAVYCSNCGEKATHRVFCECGDELRSDWGFCPGCGRRTPAADVLERS